MYVTLDDLLAEYPEAEIVQLTDDEGAGVIDQARVLTAIASATTIVDGYVAAKYRTDTTPTPRLLTELARDITWFRLHRRRAQPPERVQEAYDGALAMLEKIAKGTIKLDAGDETLAPRSGAVLVSVPVRLFGRDDMVGF